MVASTHGRDLWIDGVFPYNILISDAINDFFGHFALARIAFHNSRGNFSSATHICSWLFLVRRFRSDTGFNETQRNIWMAGHFKCGRPRLFLFLWTRTYSFYMGSIQYSHNRQNTNTSEFISGTFRWDFIGLLDLLWLVFVDEQLHIFVTITMVGIWYDRRLLLTQYRMFIYFILSLKKHSDFDVWFISQESMEVLPTHQFELRYMEEPDR